MLYYSKPPLIPVHSMEEYPTQRASIAVQENVVLNVDNGIATMLQEVNTLAAAQKWRCHVGMRLA